jgi:hypothetical protein
MEVVWDGVTQPDAQTDWAAPARAALEQAAGAHDWLQLLEVLEEHPDLVNARRLRGELRFAPLHEAAHEAAALDVLHRLIDLGALRTLRNAAGERAIDVARRRGHARLAAALEPLARHRVPGATLAQLQVHFHALIRSRADGLVQRQGLVLPELEPLLELEMPHMWFPVPGMYGGFRYRLDLSAGAPRLISESWCDVVRGSWQRHAITCEGSRVIAQARP